MPVAEAEAMKAYVVLFHMWAFKGSTVMLKNLLFHLRCVALINSIIMISIDTNHWNSEHRMNSGIISDLTIILRI